MDSLISPPPESPPFIAVPVDEDPIVKEAKTIRNNDLVSAERSGFKNAISRLSQAVQTEIERFQHNVSTRATNAKSQCDMAHSSLVALARDIDADPNGNEFAKIRSQLEKDVRTEIVDIRHDGEELTQTLFKAETAFTDFQDENGLGREPRPPQNLVVTLAILIALVIVEIVVNGFFFIDLTQHGLFGGVFEAFLFAPFNVLAASLLGYYALRYMRHRKRWLSVLAYIFGFLLLLFVFALNAYLAALRLSLKPDVVYDIPELLTIIFSSRALQIMDYTSLGILILGISLAGFACWKAYHLKDPYPGYDEVARARNAARDAVTELRHHYLNVLDTLQETAVDALHDLKEEFVDEVAQFHKLTDFLKAERKRYDTVCAEITEAFSSRQARFRQRYAAAEKLDSPELTAVIQAHQVAPRSTELLALLEPIPDTVVKEVLDIDTKIRRYVNEQEQAIANYVMAARESSGDLFKEIRNAARAL